MRIVLWTLGSFSVRSFLSVLRFTVSDYPFGNLNLIFVYAYYDKCVERIR